MILRTSFLYNRKTALEIFDKVSFMKAALGKSERPVRTVYNRFKNVAEE